MKLSCEIWPTVALSAVLLLAVSVALPMEKIVVEDNSGVTDMDYAESSKNVVYAENPEVADDSEDNEVAESPNTPIIDENPETTNDSEADDDAYDSQTEDHEETELSEASIDPVLAEPKPELSVIASRSATADAEPSETFNIPVHVEKPSVTPDFNLHSQAEDTGSESKSGFRVSLLQAPVKTRESVNLEAEAVPSKILSLYDNSQKTVLDKTQRLPIVDTISEHEKYGNNGDMFDGISRSLVNGYEAFSNFLNNIIQKPQQIFKSINKSVNAQLDILGGKLVGL